VTPFHSDKKTCNDGVGILKRLPRFFSMANLIAKDNHKTSAKKNKNIIHAN
jgi:hypothetical protein